MIAFSICQENKVESNKETSFNRKWVDKSRYLQLNFGSE